MAKKEEALVGLHRSTANRVIAGVAGGLGEYFQADPTLIRVLFLILTFFGGSGVLIYLALWLVIPSDRSTSQPKDHMRENISEMKERIHYFAEDVRAQRGNSYSERRSWLGIIIVLFGILFLLSSFNIFAWADFGRLWPIILILIGVSMIHRS